MSIAGIVASAARQLEAGLLDQTCTVTPAGGGSPVAVACMVGDPMGETRGDTGGGLGLGRPNDATVLLPLGTAVATGDTIACSDGRTYAVGYVIRPRAHDPLIRAQLVEVA